MDLGTLILKLVVQGDKAIADVVGFESAVKKTGKTVEEQDKRMRVSFKNIGDFAQRAFFTIQTGMMALQSLERLSEATNELEKSQRKLNAASKLTGADLKTLETTADGAKEKFKLNTVQTNEFTIAFSKLRQKAGEAGDGVKDIGNLLDIAAAQGLDAEQAMTAINQAIIGIDEGTDKLFQKNPSVIYAEYAKQIGTTAGKMNDQQKAQALLNEVTVSGLKVQGEYGKFLESDAGKQALAATRAKESAANFGLIYNQLKSIVLDVATPILEFFGNLDVGLLKMIVTLGGTIALLVKLPAILGGISTALKVVGVSANIATGPIGIIIGIIGVLAAVWASNLGGIQEKTKTAFSYIIATFKGAWEFIKDFATRYYNIWAGLGKVVVSALKGDLAGVKEGIGNIKGAVLGGWDETFKGVSDKFSGSVDDYKKANAEKLANEKATQDALKKTGAGGGGGTPAADPEAAKKAEAERQKLAALRLANMDNEYLQQREMAKAAYDDEVKKYAGNSAILSELRILAKNDLAKIDADYAEKQKAELDKQAQEEKKHQDALNALRIEAMDSDIEQRRARLDLWLAEKQEKWVGNAEALELIEQTHQQRLADIDRAAKDEQKKREDERWAQHLEANNVMYETAASAYDTFWGTLSDTEMTGAERLKSVIDSIKNAFIQSWSQRLKAYIAMKIKETAIEKTAAATQRGIQATNIASENKLLIKAVGQNLAAMAARLFGGLAKAGPLGFLAGIAGVIGAVALAKSVIGGLRGFATGGLVDRPELILAGEAGPEIIAPQRDFMDVMRSMQIRGALAGGAGMNVSPIVARLDRLETAITNMEVKLYADDAEIARSSIRGQIEIAGRIL